MIGATRTPILFILQDKWAAGDNEALGKPPFGRVLPATVYTITGITKDSAGAVLGDCTVSLFRTVDDLFFEKVISDAVTGFYSFSSVGLSESYYVIAYKAGAPDVAGTTRNDLVGT